MSKTDDDFKKAETELQQADFKNDPQYVEWPASLRWLPCSTWKRDTWCGFSAILSGICFQWGLGVFAMWGGVVMYFTSHFRAFNSDLYMETTLYTVPITLAALTGGM